MPSSNRISTINSLQPTGFTFALVRCPNVQWFVQEAILPGVSLGDASKYYATGKAAIAGDTLLYNEFQFDFTIDENLSNWIEIYNWSRGLAPTRLGAQENQYTTLAKSDFGTVSDGVLTVMTNANNPNITIYFKDLFPLSLSDIPLKTTDTTIEPIMASVRFKYTSYNIEIETAHSSINVEGNII